jgi:hypothetical protein
LGDGDADHARLVAAFEIVQRLWAVKELALVERSWPGITATPESRGGIASQKSPTFQAFWLIFP